MKKKIRRYVITGPKLRAHVKKTVGLYINSIEQSIDSIEKMKMDKQVKGEVIWALTEAQTHLDSLIRWYMDLQKGIVYDVNSTGIEDVGKP